MTEEPMTGPDPADPDAHVDATPSTDLVVPARRPVARPVGRLPDLAVRARHQLDVLRQNPAAALAMSAVAAVGGAVLTAGLRRTLGQALVPPAGRTGSLSIGGYVVHEVHVVHHVVHHVIGPAAADRRSP
jgi:hypothetical protein